MMLKLENKVAIVTGAGRGIGKSIAISLAQEGVRIAAASRTTRDLERLCEEIKQLGGDAHPLTVDVTDEVQVKKLVEETHRVFGHIDILVNNAGVGMFSKVEAMKTEDFQSMIDVNLLGVFFCTRAVLPFMTKQNDGVIVNVASLAGRNAFVGGAGYCATKWALIGFARCLMLEVRQHNIRVITICPGSVETSFSRNVSGKTDILLPQDVADTVVAAVKMPTRAMVSEIDIRPTNPK